MLQIVQNWAKIDENMSKLIHIGQNFDQPNNLRRA
jgi:hypothetical protein